MHKPYKIKEIREYRDWDTCFEFQVTDIPDNFGNYMIIRFIPCIGGSGSNRLTYLDPKLWANTKVIPELSKP